MKIVWKKYQSIFQLQINVLRNVDLFLNNWKKGIDLKLNNLFNCYFLIWELLAFWCHMEFLCRTSTNVKAGQNFWDCLWQLFSFLFLRQLENKWLWRNQLKVFFKRNLQMKLLNWICSSRMSQSQQIWSSLSSGTQPKKLYLLLCRFLPKQEFPTKKCIFWLFFEKDVVIFCFQNNIFCF